MIVKDLKILDDFLDRTENLPDILHLRAAEIGYKITEEDKTLLFDTYQKLDDILKEVAVFINIKFPSCERHVKAWNEIDFDTKIGSFKVITTDREHIKREWRKGLFDLKSLIKTLKNEISLLIEESEEKPLPIWNEKNFYGDIMYNENSNRGEQNISKSNDKKEKNSWIEIISWIAGIIGTLIALYTFLK